MKLFVQARKDGYNVLYPKPTPTEFFQFAGDIRPDGKDSNLLGKYLYTIAFVSGGCIFTKHIIIQDIQRQGLGNIGFSVFVPNIKKLSGYDAIKLLDELLDTYCKNYCPDYYLENKREDWAIFEAIKNQYDLEDLSNDNIENYQRGTNEPAFFYYTDKTQLCKIFDNPYQEEFSIYKQVFFVEENLKDESCNPLNAIPHDPSANLTGKIDLENPKYTLIYDQHTRDGLNIEVRVNGNLRYGKSKIKRKEDLQITWSKEFHQPKEMSGKWYDIGSDYLEINDIEKKVSIKKIDLKPIEYSLTIKTIDIHKNPINDAYIELLSNHEKQKATNNSFLIRAKDLQKKYYVLAKKGDLSSVEREIKDEEIKANSIIELVLSKPVEVEFEVKDENGISINDFDLEIVGKKEHRKGSKVTFIGEEIDKTWNISVSHSDYETKCFNYCPAKDEKLKTITLKKKTSSPQKELHEKKIVERQENSSSKGSQPVDSSNAWYRKVSISLLLWVFVISIFASIVFLLVNSDGSENQTPTAQNEMDVARMTYIKGIELNLDTLNHYKEICYDTNTPSNKEEEGLWQKIWAFFPYNNSSNSHVPSATPNNDFCLKIDSVIAMREAINLGEIDKLKGRTFSTLQQKFKKAIDSIEDKDEKDIGETLKKDTVRVSRMNLNEIAELIRKRQEELKKKKESQKGESNSKDNSAKGEKKDSQKEETPSKQKTPSTPRVSDKYLAQKFWGLVKETGKPQFDAHRNLLKKYSKDGQYLVNYLSEDEKSIIRFLEEICKNSKTFEKYALIDELDRRKAKDLDDLRNLIKNRK